MKIALAFAAAVTITTYSVFAFVYWRVLEADVALVRSVLQDESVRAAAFPDSRIQDQLTLRLTHDLRRLDYVGILDAHGRLIFGNVPAGVRVPIDGEAHLVEVPLNGTEDARQAIFVARARANGTSLLLGRGLVEIYNLRTIMRQAFLLAILPICFGALVIGVLVAYRASRRLASIRLAIVRVMGGDLQVRLPERGGTDDVSELVRAVNLMLDEIGRLVNQIRSVGDNIAHDLRTPLAVMRARLERGLHARSEPMLQAAAEEAVVDLDKAMSTVTALLRISELENGRRRRAFRSVDLVAICQDIHELYEPVAADKQVQLAFDAPHALSINGDADLLREAVLNLVDNAVKFTPPGGIVTLECGCNDALVRVVDDGPGIVPEDREKIFRRFYRSAPTAHVGGVGLGLSMASTIVELHGLRLILEHGGPGAAFRIAQGPGRAEKHPPNPL